MKDLVRIAFVVVFLLSAGGAVLGQARRTESSSLVMYDPVFWRTKLRLREDQCRSIREINAQYYERLVSLDKPALGGATSTLAMVEKYLADRNEKIWNIFQPVQRKRWIRLWDHQYAATVHQPGDTGTAQSSAWTLPPSVFTADSGPKTVDQFRPEILIHRLL